MQRNALSGFSGYHPAVNFLFFGTVFGFSMFSMHPVCLLFSFLAAAGYYISLRGAKALRFLLRGVLPLWLFTIIINPVFSHEGQTVLCYLPTGNPLTLESILYGIAAGFLLASFLLWFACFSEVVTSDKLIYLFGRIIPSLSLLLSMTLRFVPRFSTQLEHVREVQSMLGRDTSQGGLLKRIRNAVACFSIVVTWSLESAIETADSMKSRGYGTGRRTAYAVYRWTDRDTAATVFLLLCALFLLAGSLSGNLSWRYFPSVRGALTDPPTLALQAVWLLLCLMPIIIDRKEERAWKRLSSGI